MAKYEVTFRKNVYASKEIEAETQQEAEKIANNMKKEILLESGDEEATRLSRWEFAYASEIYQNNVR